MNTKRIFMTEEGGSPGGGAVPPVPPAPDAAPKAPEQPAPLTADTVATIVATAVDAKLKAFENGLFANARKAGLLGKDKSAPDSSATPPASAAAPASTGLTEADLEARLEQERVITRVQVENKLSDAAVKRLKSAMRAEKPDDVSSWTSAYLADLGLVRQAESPTPAPSAPVVPNVAPISDRGSPAPNGAVGWRYELNNPIGMSAAARAQMDAELGVEKARRMRLDAARNQASTLKVAFGPKG